MQMMADNKLRDNFSKARATPPFHPSPTSWYRAQGEDKLFFV